MAERTALDVLPVTGLAELFAHIDALDADPSTPIEPKLFDDVELQVTEANTRSLLPSLLPRLNALLFTINTQDPTPLLTLTTKLLSPIPFQEVLNLATPDALLVALHSTLPGANLLALSIIHKAAASSDDVRVLAERMEGLVGEMVTLWIGTKDTGVAEKASRVIGELLQMDCEVVVPPPQRTVNGTTMLNGASTSKLAQRRHRLETPGAGLLWRLVLENPDNLVRIIANCSLALPPAVQEALPPGATVRAQTDITVSQGRLLRLLPRLVALNIQPLLSDHSPLLQPFQEAATHASPANSTNVLSWAALEMVDSSDLLMQLTLVDFFEELVSVARVSTHQSPVKDETVKRLVREAIAQDGSGQLRQALVSLPDRTVEEEAEPLREYLQDVV